MLSSHPGTSVPKSFDSSDLPPNFKVSPRRKKPIIGITFFHLSEGEWEVWFMRMGKRPAKYTPSARLASLLVNLIRGLEVQNMAFTSADLTGWSCIIDRAVYPPPKVSQGQPERDPFGVPYNDEDKDSCPFCASDDITTFAHAALGKTDNEPDAWECHHCGNYWEEGGA